MEFLSDTLARIHNAVLVEKKEVLVKNSNLVRSVLSVMKYEKMIDGFDVTEDGVLVKLKYVDGESVVKHFEKVSKPGQRIYVGSADIKPVMNGRGIAIISTSKGVLSGAVAKSKALGGEYLCKVW